MCTYRGTPGLILITLALLFLGTAVAAEKPNIVIILVDDMGYGDPGCYNPDSKISTPHIDSLAQEGMRFTNAFLTASSCSPAALWGILPR